MKHTNPPKKLQDMNLMDRFLFSETIENAEAYKIILEIILDKEINLKGEPIAENEKRKELLGKIARLDVCAIGDDDRIYNAEVQKENQNNMHKRMRYYGALMTSKLLPEGTVNYNRLNDLCMIVIAGFDMGGEGNASLQLVTLVCCPFRLQIAFALWTKRQLSLHSTQNV